MNTDWQTKAYLRRKYADTLRAINEMYDLAVKTVPGDVALELDKLRHEACANIAEIEYNHMILLKPN